MKKIFSKMKKNNSGFSLIELVVTILISGLVLGSAAILISLGGNQFSRISAEESVQSEAQFTDYFITELFQEALDFTKLDATELSGGASTAVQVVREDGTYMLAHIGTTLYFGAVDESKTKAEQLSQLIGLGKAKSFLAKNVETFSFTETSYTSAMSTNGFLVIGYKISFMNKSFSGSSFIKLRNRKVN